MVCLIWGDYSRIARPSGEEGAGTRSFEALQIASAAKFDTGLDQDRTVAAIVAAVADSGLEKLVMESTYGVRT